jgi:hypothetical protein
VNQEVVRIGGFSAFWGDTPEAARQLVTRGEVHYLVGDYLAEVTMSLLARARLKDPAAGFAPDLVTALAPLLQEIASRGIKVVSNAGGMNPQGCRDALARAAEAAGVRLRIAVIEGDDLLPSVESIRALDPREMFSGAPLPARLTSINAYLGAFAIASALAAGADIVLTGRCVDSALALGPLIHEFGWAEDDYDRLSAGSLAGHLIECGAQCTGGNFTDWQCVPGWDDMGFPVAECHRDGRVFITKPPGTGGLVSPATVGEQLVYEIGDPGAYLLPDVICDWTGVTLAQDGPDRVRVSGARGRAPGDQYKVCATYGDGFRAMGTLLIAGFDAGAKAQRQGEAIVARARRLALAQGHGDFTQTSVEVIGLEQCYGTRARATDPREAVLKIGVRHDRREAVELFGREFAPSATAMAQGTTGLIGGRPSATPVIRLFSFLLSKTQVAVRVRLDGEDLPCRMPAVQVAAQPTSAHPRAASPGDAAAPAPAGTAVALRRLAWARSGDKGDHANIGVIARRPEFVSLLREQLTPLAVAADFAHYLGGPVRRWEMPGLQAFNFVLQNVLGGGGMASLRYDPQGKTYAALLLDHPIVVPDGLLPLLEAPTP